MEIPHQNPEVNTAPEAIEVEEQQLVVDAVKTYGCTSWNLPSHEDWADPSI